MSLSFPDDRAYHTGHLWAKPQADGSVLIGITDYAQNQLGSVIFVELPTTGSHFAQHESCASIESVKVTSEALIPMSGCVLEVNTALDDTPDLLNQSPYDQGWLIRIMPDNIHEAGRISAAAYAACVA